MPSPFLQFAFRDPAGAVRPLRFTAPVEVIVAERVEDVLPALIRVREATERGLYAAGYVAYEAAPAFDGALRVQSPGETPLLWFGLFTAPAEGPEPGGDGAFQVGEWRPSVTRAEYDAAIAAIREAIARGETYQVNHTLRLRAPFSGDDRAFHRRLVRAQRAGYSAYLDLGRFRILSASPELFFHRLGSRIWTRPMKGTRRRGRYPDEDAARRSELAAAAKDRAENLMIVDLMRNDLGRIAEPGSVRVPRLFEVEAYPTVLQMTSTVEAELRPDVRLEEIFQALFPCGSVTGAPKVSTMRLITGLEDAPRGVYCGSIGYVTPDGEAVFNVAIRTVVVDTETGAAEYGVGGGIVWDSSSEAEYAETVAKAAVLTEERPEFDLLETLRLENGEYALRERHLERVQASAAYFGFPLAPESAASALRDYAAAHPEGAWRVRLLVAESGGARVEGAPLAELPAGPLPVALSDRPVSRRDPFLFHKTTHRRVYEERKSGCPDLFDVLLWNEEGELTEFTTGNLVVELEGERWTPPVDSGLLAGTLRAELLHTDQVRERVLTREDLARVERVWYVNGVRGWVEVRCSPLAAD